MKRMFIALLAALLALSPVSGALAVETLSEDAIDIASPSAVLMEKATGDVIYEKAAHEKRLPASVTKVMTLLLIAEAVDSGQIKPEDMVTGSKKAASMGGSQVWLEEGEALSVSDMIKCICVVSANDCAVAMAEHLCGTEDAFVERMNARVLELGLTDTHFTNCTGLFDASEHYTSAYDVAVMSRELMRHDWIRNYTTLWMDSIRDGASELTNTNKLVRFYPGCTGLKTGFTSGAMYCVSATAERDGVEYIAVIMHGETIEKRNEDAKTLLNYAFANYTLVSLRMAEPLPPVKVVMGEAEAVQPVYTGEEALLLPKLSAGEAEYKLELIESVEAPVSKGDALGTLTVTSGDKTLARVELVAGAEVPRLGTWGAFVKLLRILASAERDL